MIRPVGQDDPRLIKGIGDWTSLRAGFEHCVNLASNREVFVELDLRALPIRHAWLGG